MKKRSRLGGVHIERREGEQILINNELLIEVYAIAGESAKKCRIAFTGAEGKYAINRVPPGQEIDSREDLELLKGSSEEARD